MIRKTRTSKFHIRIKLERDRLGAHNHLAASTEAAPGCAQGAEIGARYDVRVCAGTHNGFGSTLRSSKVGDAGQIGSPRRMAALGRKYALG